MHRELVGSLPGAGSSAGCSRETGMSDTVPWAEFII